MRRAGYDARLNDDATPKPSVAAAPVTRAGRRGLAAPPGVGDITDFAAAANPKGLSDAQAKERARLELARSAGLGDDATFEDIALQRYFAGAAASTQEEVIDVEEEEPQPAAAGGGRGGFAAPPPGAVRRDEQGIVRHAAGRGQVRWADAALLNPAKSVGLERAHEYPALSGRGPDTPQTSRPVPAWGPSSSGGGGNAAPSKDWSAHFRDAHEVSRQPVESLPQDSLDESRVLAAQGVQQAFRAQKLNKLPAQRDAADARAFGQLPAGTPAYVERGPVPESWRCGTDGPPGA